MYFDINDVPEDRLRPQLDKYVSLFGVAYEALLLMSNAGFTKDRREYSAEAVAMIKRYPNDKRYRFDAPDASEAS
jgi:hypothetical protein